MNKVELISKTIGVGRYKELTAEEIIAAIARHGTIKNDNGKLVKYLMDNKHLSPLQHISFGFKIQTSRGISAQVFRHQSLEFQEWSQRYSESAEFEPIELRREHPTNRQSSTEVFDPIVKVPWGDELLRMTAREAIDNAIYVVDRTYRALIEQGVARECARGVLPMCTTTIIHVTGNLRNLLGYLNLRLDEHTQLEHRIIAKEIAVILKEELPDIFKVIDIDKGMFL